MALVPCESCRRHLRVTENVCPFCKTVRAGTTVVAVAGTMLALAGCETYSPAAKYGGPPMPDPVVTMTQVDAAPPAPSAPVYSPASKYGGPPMAPTTPAPTPDKPDASPRLK